MSVIIVFCVITFLVYVAKGGSRKNVEKQKQLIRELFELYKTRSL